VRHFGGSAIIPGDDLEASASRRRLAALGLVLGPFFGGGGGGASASVGQVE